MMKKHVADLTRNLLIIMLISLSALPFKVVGQDVEGALKSPVLTANGGISISQIATFTPLDSVGPPNPYALYVGGSLNFSLFGVVNVPLSFAYTNQQLSKNVSLPFNRFSLSPSYKWVKTYMGYTSMQFSPYSLAGHELFGGGVELTPNEQWTVSALYGRLQKPSLGEEGTDPAYKRMGGGLKVGYKGQKFDLAANVFNAQDNPSSVHFDNPDSIGLSPQANLSGSVEATIKLIPHLSWQTEYGFSSLNRNRTESDMALYHAINTRLTYSTDLGSIGGAYERVAPNYTTLGAYYMTNDYENITGSLSTVIKNINIALEGGYQRDNLDNQKNSSASRIIYSGNISANVSKRLSLAASFSNLQSYLYINDVYSQVTQTNQFENLDTLNVTQLNYTASLNASYLLQSTEKQRQNLSANFQYQKSAEAQQYSAFAGTNIYNTALSYQLSFVPSKLDMSASTAYSYTQGLENMDNKSMTYNLSVQKTFFEKLKTAFNSTYSNMNQSGNELDVLNLRFSAGTTLWKRHNVNFSFTTLYSEGNIRKQLQHAANLTYSYVFNSTLSRQGKQLHLDSQF
ncbi:porin family protein [Viscerimonas tarda]